MAAPHAASLVCRRAPGGDAIDPEAHHRESACRRRDGGSAGAGACRRVPSEVTPGAATPCQTRWQRARSDSTHGLVPAVHQQGPLVGGAVVHLEGSLQVPERGARRSSAASLTQVAARRSGFGGSRPSSSWPSTRTPSTWPCGSSSGTRSGPFRLRRLPTSLASTIGASRRCSRTRSTTAGSLESVNGHPLHGGLHRLSRTNCGSASPRCGQAERVTLAALAWSVSTFCVGSSTASAVSGSEPMGRWVPPPRQRKLHPRHCRGSAESPQS